MVIIMGFAQKNLYGHWAGKETTMKKIKKFEIILDINDEVSKRYLCAMSKNELTKRFGKANILKCREIPDYVGIDKVDEALALADFGQAERELVRSLLTDFVDYGEEGEETIDE